MWQIWPTSFLRPVSEREKSLFFPTRSALRFGISAVPIFTFTTVPTIPAKGSAFCVCFRCPVVGVYLLRCVEAAEAVGDFRWGHLEQPTHVSARPEGGSVAFYFLHVCPCRVSIRSPFTPQLYIVSDDHSMKSLICAALLLPRVCSRSLRYTSFPAALFGFSDCVHFTHLSKHWESHVTEQVFTVGRLGRPKIRI